MKRVFLALGLILALFGLSRCFHLTFNPIFTDEAIYIRWAQIAKSDANWRFISLTDGKQPLFIWAVMILLRFVNDPILAGRLVSVLSGMMTVIGLFLLSKTLFQSWRVGLLTAGLYVIYPFALVYDRMALMDGMVGMFAIWALFLEVLLVRSLRLDVALILGMVIGGGTLTKSSGFFNLYLLPFSLWLFFWGDKRRLKRLFLWLGLTLLVVAESQGIYSVLRLSPFFHLIREKNTVFVYSFADWWAHPWRFFVGNLKGLINWFSGYFGWPMLITVIGGLVMRRFFKEKILLLAWFVPPFLLLALLGKVLYPRFIFFMTLTLLPISALLVERILLLGWKRKWTILVFFVFIFNWLWTDWQWLTVPYQAKIPMAEKGQYLDGWPAGGGIVEAVTYFKQEAQGGPIYLATEGTFGLLPYALEIYLHREPNIQIKGFWPLEERLPTEILASVQRRPTYLILNQTQKPLLSWPVELIKSYPKGSKDFHLSIYRVISEK